MEDVISLQRELKMQEAIYIAMMKADEPVWKLKRARLKIKELKKNLRILSNLVNLDTLN